jgi:hypothetical protein
VTAKDDADFGVNAEVEYVKIGGNGSDLFDVGKTTGWVSVKSASLAGRLLESYTLVVRAVDRGVPPQSDQAVITLVITGENRYSPVFTALSYQVNKNNCFICICLCEMLCRIVPMLLHMYVLFCVCLCVCCGEMPTLLRLKTLLKQQDKFVPVL